MKTITILLLTLLISLTLFGTAVVAYANGAVKFPGQVQVTVTPQPTAQSQATQPTVTPTSVPLKPILYHGNSDKPEIALTFDDGPNPTYTPQILSILQQYGIHATFFTIGEQVQSYPYLIQQEYAAGHVIGNHTWNHPDLTTLSADAIYTEISDTSAILQQTIGVQPTYFRPPYGAINNAVYNQASQLALTSTLWSIDTRDWQTPGTQVIINRVLNEAENGSIILMHDGGGDRSQSVVALTTIIPTLQQRGFQFVTIQQLADDAQQTDSPTSTNLLTASASLSAFLAVLVVDIDTLKGTLSPS